MPGELVSVGINGFGPVGRNVFYAALQDPRVCVVAVNDPSFNTACAAYLMERECPGHATAAGALHAVEVVDPHTVVLNGTHRVAVTQETRPTQWAALGVRVVLDCTGTNTTRERCHHHVSFGAGHVVVAAHSVDAPLVLPSLRPAAALSAEGRAVQVHSCGSRLGAVLAPFLRLIDATLGLVEASYTAISGLSDEADPAAGRSTDPMEWRQLRLQQSMATGKGAFAPSARDTGVATLEKLFPQLQGRVLATAFQVPGHKGCAIDLLVRTERAASKEELDGIITSAAADTAAETVPFVKLIDSGRPSGAVISTDCLGTDCLVYEQGVSTTACDGHSHKLMLWVDLEWAYAKRVVCIAKEVAALQPAS